MNKHLLTLTLLLLCTFIWNHQVVLGQDFDQWWPEDLPQPVATPLLETPQQHEARMAWWREARFGLFIHWGLYAIPAGTWEGRKTGGAEWILNTAQIHPDAYMPLQKQFDPVDFDAEQWVDIAKNAGMKYIVITSKHHDGFCLWPSKYTDFDIAGTPFQRDILEELASACRREGIILCFYHSIMDWTHLDYLPRRAWDDRPAANAEFDAYAAYMQTQVDELIDTYQPAVLWFDGEWEGTWTHAHGQALYDHLRKKAPWLIINNRIDTGRTGMAGLTRAGGYRGDFGTPEQQIPATGFPPGVDWETCMTMNRSWGWQSFDDNWKSTTDLVRKLVDIASKGGNFLLNVGPMANGAFPPEAVQRLQGIGRWMKINARSIQGTFASPFTELPWGRCTRRALPDGNERLYLHVFARPSSGQLRLTGLMNQPIGSGAHLLADPDGATLPVHRDEASLVVTVPESLPDDIDTVVYLDIAGEAVVVGAPAITPDSGSIFIDSIDVSVSIPSEEITVRYTLDGSDPDSSSRVYERPVTINRSTTISARCFLGNQPVSQSATARYEKVMPRKAVQFFKQDPGLQLQTWLGSFDKTSDFHPKGTSPLPDVHVVEVVDLSMQPRPEDFGMVFDGHIQVPATGLYRFALDSDDGSQLWVASKLLIDNDGLHSAKRMEGTIALEQGNHPFKVVFFEKTGQEDLLVEWAPPGSDFRSIPSDVLFH